MEINRAAWDALLYSISPEYLEETLLGGNWSVKDIVAHVMSYEAWVGGQIYPDLRQYLPIPPEEMDVLDSEQINEWYYWLHHERSIDEILHESRWFFDQLIAGVNACSEEDLNMPVRLNEYRDLEVTTWEDTSVDPLWPLWKWIASNAYEHYPQHIMMLRLWIDRQLGLY
jgi:hypothetical protein